MKTWSVHMPVLVREAGHAGNVLDEREHAMTLRFDVQADSAEDAAKDICDRIMGMREDYAQ